jgi:hypothetical protein
MKTSLPFVFAVMLSAALTRAETPLMSAERSYSEALDRAQINYRRELAVALKAADKIELFLLDFEPTASPDAKYDSAWAIRLPKDAFPIIPYQSQSRILSRKVLTADERQLLLPPLQATVGVEKNTYGAMCHFPIHGIRAWVGKEILFQTSVCWHCSNFYVEYPIGGALWTGLSTPDLKLICERLLPIPQKEIDRFNKKYGESEKKDQRK